MIQDTQDRKDRGGYVLVTAAYNEEALIETALSSVAAQTILPRKWVIVSDGSTDRTDEIVQQYAKAHGFISLYRISRPHPRNFAAQVDAINTGYSQLKSLQFRFVGNLDADISLESTYFADLLAAFQYDRLLGLSGGVICEEQNGAFLERSGNRPTSVPHGVQMFRRECFEALGGYARLPYGGPDWHAEVSLRMRGWHVHTVPGLKAFHHRPTGSAGNRLRYWYQQGLMDFSLGSHPLFEMFKLARRLRGKPFLLGALARLAAFASAYCKGQKRMVSTEFVRFLRKEQMERLRQVAWRTSGGSFKRETASRPARSYRG